MENMNIKDLIKEYLETLNRAELRRAVALALENEKANQSFENKISLYSTFIFDLCRITGDLVAVTMTTEEYMGVTVSYYKTIVM